MLTHHTRFRVDPATGRETDADRDGYVAVSGGVGHRQMDAVDDEAAVVEVHRDVWPSQTGGSRDLGQFRQ
ncbi:hypothetical protein [Rhodococcus sp. WB9]|uniref:hypothetical protein n=1 Tax=Rhodococcus sp. WB9 TaxID=2594007 RepID=UPI0016434D98|nr:hypothetical protein [Rhodococcus sp. WB9]